MCHQRIGYAINIIIGKCLGFWWCCFHHFGHARLFDIENICLSEISILFHKWTPEIDMFTSGTDMFMVYLWAFCAPFYPNLIYQVAILYLLIRLWPFLTWNLRMLRLMFACKLVYSIQILLCTALKLCSPYFHGNLGWYAKTLFNPHPATPNFYYHFHHLTIWNKPVRKSGPVYENPKWFCSWNVLF